ncbi:MAG: hypothetical protein KC656_03460 [Myxococcales bacterium]|nr:hypothetical protein [Myxococcales bacterium]
MESLEPRSVRALARLRPSPLGSPLRWTLDATVLGGLAGWTVGVQVLGLGPLALGGVALGMLHGLVLGVGGFALLNEGRRQVPLAGLALGVPLLAAAVSTALAFWSAALVGFPPAVAVALAVPACAATAAVAWLPYTFAAVMDLPRWPVLVAAWAFVAAVVPFLL